MWRHALKTRDPEKIVDCTHGLLATTVFHGVTTLREIYARCERRTGRTAELSATVTV